MTTETHRGTVRRVFSCYPDRPWMAGVLGIDGGKELRFSGKLAAKVGDVLEITGQAFVDPKYGRQFKVDSAVVKMDESPDAFANLLANDKRFAGLGPVRAKKVADAALAMSDDGEIASALEKYPEQIAARAGVPFEIVKNAAKVWGSQRNYFQALAELTDQGWSNGQAQSIIHVLGETAPQLVRNDPYMLVKRIPRFGFRTVDVIATGPKIGVAACDARRLVAGVAYCLDEMGSKGNTWTTRAALLFEAVKQLRPDTLDGEDLIADALKSLIAEGLVHVDTSPTGAEVIANAHLAQLEFEVFDRLVAGMSTDIELAAEENDHEGARSIDFNAKKGETSMRMLNDDQAAAVYGFAQHRVTVLCGGAGVGKTFTMGAICDVAEGNGLQVALCAPTGKAARRLADATRREAMTIHRLLEPSYNEVTGAFMFSRSKDYPIDADLVVVDEVSMVDVRLMHSLLNALRPSTRLLLVGDHHQIPSVSPGAILRDLLAARPRYPNAVHVLTKIVRQAGDLARNTTAILDGIVVAEQSPVWGFYKTERGGDENVAELVAQYVGFLVTSEEPLPPFNRPLDLAWDVQVLTPTKKGDLGSWAINVYLQRLRQRLLGNPMPDGEPDDSKSPKPLVGDRVIWTKNDYTLNLFNGTLAIVTAIRREGGMDLRCEDGREVTIPAEKRANVELAYAMTIHKAQGSEWPCVLLVASSKHWIMHDRNLLYTGASRASLSLTIFGDAMGIRHFATERRSERRQTFGAFLVEGWTPRQRVAPAAPALPEAAPAS